MRLLRNAAAFVLGFSLVFVAAGPPAWVPGRGAALSGPGAAADWRHLPGEMGRATWASAHPWALMREWRPHYRPARRTTADLGAGRRDLRARLTPCIGAILGTATAMALVGQDRLGAC
ncbi:MAG: hypothetical protein U0841_23350 [Chloroflexia bacterium]